MGHLGSIPGLGRSLGKGKGYPLQYSGLENPRNSIVYGVAKSQRQLSDFQFHFHADYIMQNAGLNESQTGIMIARRNTSYLRYAHYATHMAESKEELKSLLMKVKEESEKSGLNLNIHTIMASAPITSW